MSTIEEQLVEARMKEYAEASKNDANVDKAALAIAALESVQNGSGVSPKMKKWVYLASLALPPIGFIFALWYLFSKKIDGKRVALVCAIITVGSLLLSWLVFLVFVASMPPQTLEQVRALNPNELNDIKDLLLQ
jgi:hypothetical protein